jgi:hypothetical protein
LLIKPKLARPLVALIGAAALPLLAPTLGQAQQPSAADANDYTCVGHLGNGKPEPGATGTQVRYSFICNGPITGYQVQSQLPINGFDSSPNPPVELGTGATFATDSLTCNGNLPGYAVNCVGQVTNAWERVIGQFSIGARLCAEPRDDALLTVTYAAVVKGVATQYISGPYDLGRPRGCPASPYSGQIRLSGKAPAPLATKPGGA